MLGARPGEPDGRVAEDDGARPVPRDGALCGASALGAEANDRLGQMGLTSVFTVADMIRQRPGGVAFSGIRWGSAPSPVCQAAKAGCR